MRNASVKIQDGFILKFGEIMQGLKPRSTKSGRSYRNCDADTIPQAYRADRCYRDGLQSVMFYNIDHAEFEAPLYNIDLPSNQDRLWLHRKDTDPHAVGYEMIDNEVLHTGRAYCTM